MDEPQSIWRTVAKAIGWTAAILIGAAIVAINWPLERETWWMILAWVWFMILHWAYQDHQAAVRHRHAELARQLHGIDYKLGQIEHLLTLIENPDWPYTRPKNQSQTRQP